MDIRHPNVEVKLVGRSGNAYTVLGAVDKALQHAGVSKAERDEFRVEAMAGDYDHLLRTTMSWVDVT